MGQKEKQKEKQMHLTFKSQFQRNIYISMERKAGLQREKSTKNKAKQLTISRTHVAVQKFRQSRSRVSMFL